MDCHERDLYFKHAREDLGRLNIFYSWLLLVVGKLKTCMSICRETLPTLEDEDLFAIVRITNARANLLRGEIRDALDEFDVALLILKKSSQDALAFLGVWHCLSLMLIGRNDEAKRLTYENKKLLQSVTKEMESYISHCNLVMGELACKRGDLADAQSFLREAHEWALQRDAKELLCWSALVRAKIELSAFSDQRSKNQADAQAGLAHGAALEEGLRIARDCGYGIYHIDLLLVRAQLALHEGRAADAEQDVRVALDEGVHPPAESGFPELLAATDPECLYAWGIVEGRQLLAEALLLHAAQKLGKTEFAPKRFAQLPTEVQDLIGRAREQLTQALELWRQLKDPESDADINPRGERTRSVIEQLEGGVLTEYPLEPQEAEKPEKPTELQETPEPDRGTKAVAKKHVFLSYCRDNKAEVAKLHDDLIVAGEPVWWDQDILPGQDWKFKIRKAMKDAYAVVLCLSKETADRITTGIYPEVLDAIDAYRQYAPGSVFLIPVRLSDCEIPLIEIDGTRTLDRLQLVDLFPASQRAAGLGQLVKALQAAPHHP